MSRFIQTCWYPLKNTFNTPAWKRSLPIWLVLNLFLSGLGALLWKLQGSIQPIYPFFWWGVTPVEEGLAGALEGVWLRWDVVHYLRIAQEGYTTLMASAYFPLYPLLGRAAGWLLGGDALGGLLLVSRLAFLLALVVLYKMTAEKFGDSMATFTILFTALYPMGVYWCAPYPLSLALLLSMLSLRWAMQRRWLAAALAGLAAGLTHGTTLPLALALFTVWLLQVRRERRAWLLLPAVATPTLGTLLFFVWRIHLGLPAMSEVLGNQWERAMRAPWMIVDEFYRFFTQFVGRADGWINLALFLFGVGMLVVCIRKLEPPLWVYQLSLIVYLCSTTEYYTPFGSYGRYLMVAFPMFMTLPLVVRRKRARMALSALWAFSMLFLAVVYLEWRWIA
jgi:hypothetical protein